MIHTLQKLFTPNDEKHIDDLKSQIKAQLQLVNHYDSEDIIEHNFDISLNELINCGDSQYIMILMDMFKTQIRNKSNDNTNAIKCYNNLCNDIDNLIRFLINNYYSHKFIAGTSRIK